MEEGTFSYIIRHLVAAKAGAEVILAAGEQGRVGVDGADHLRAPVPGRRAGALQGRQRRGLEVVDGSFPKRGRGASEIVGSF